MRGDDISDWSSDIRSGGKLRFLKYILKYLVISLIESMGEEEIRISGLSNGMYKNIFVGFLFFSPDTNQFWHQLGILQLS